MLIRFNKAIVMEELSANFFNIKITRRELILRFESHDARLIEIFSEIKVFHSLKTVIHFVHDNVTLARVKAHD